MSKSKASGGLISELFSVSLYKRSQGQKVRQVTAVAVAITFLVAAWSLHINVFGNSSELVKNGVPAVVAALGCWFAYRIVNYPPAADFLIGVQSEVDKVSWPTWPQLWRATIVVLVVMVFLSIVLLLFDMVWQYLFSLLGFLRV